MKHIVGITIDNKRYGIPEEVFNYIKQCCNKIKQLEEELNELKSDYSIVVTGYKKQQDKVLELSNHIALYSNEETMLKEINKLTAESTEWESKYYLEQERNNKAIEYIGNGNLKITKRVRKKFIKILKGENYEENEIIN